MEEVKNLEGKAEEQGGTSKDKDEEVLKVADAKDDSADPKEDSKLLSGVKVPRPKVHRLPLCFNIDQTRAGCSQQ